MLRKFIFVLRTMGLFIYVKKKTKSIRLLFPNQLQLSKWMQMIKQVKDDLFSAGITTFQNLC